MPWEASQIVVFVLRPPLPRGRKRTNSTRKGATEGGKVKGNGTATPIDSPFPVNLYSQFDIQLHVYVVTQAGAINIQKYVYYVVAGWLVGWLPRRQKHRRRPPKGKASEMWRDTHLSAVVAVFQRNKIMHSNHDTIHFVVPDLNPCQHPARAANG